jgi:hypothetical protein
MTAAVMDIFGRGSRSLRIVRRCTRSGLGSAGTSICRAVRAPKRTKPCWLG